MPGSRKKTAARRAKLRAKAKTSSARTPRSARVVWDPLRASSALRGTKIMTAQARIASGYYDREDVRELLVDALVTALSRH